MTTISSRAVAAAFASLLLMSTAFAQTAAPAKSDTPAAAPAPAADPATADKKAQKPRSAASLECSKEADAKGLHGKKDRKPFMSECKRAAKEAAAAKK
jgi:psiF repeat